MKGLCNIAIHKEVTGPDPLSNISGIKLLKVHSDSCANFFKQLEKGSNSLDNSINKRVADLESEEGFRRLVEQEKAYLFDTHIKHRRQRNYVPCTILL